MKRLRGSIIIEASFVMPVVLLVIIFVINCAFFMYDRCVILGCMEEYVSSYSLEYRINKNEADIKTNRIIEGKLLNRVFNSNDVFVDQYSENDTIAIQTDYMYTLKPFDFISKFNINSTINPFNTVEYKIITPEKNIRNTILLKSKGGEESCNIQ